MDCSSKKTVEDINVFGKRVLLRCDFNVPINEKKEILNTKRIDESLETIRYLISKEAKIIIVSHLGRPKGIKKHEYSLKPVVNYISQVLNKDIYFVEEDICKSEPKILSDLQNGDIAILENIRFYKEEEKNDEGFSKKLASFADIYVNDAFGTLHRAHASTHGVTKFIPSVCGFLVKKEINVLNKILNEPKRPFVAILGGAKVSDKIEVINNLLKKVDVLIVAGGMAYTFLNALGYSVGNSILESEKVDLAKNIIEEAKNLGVGLVLPVDVVVGKDFSENTEFITVDSDNISDGYVGLDIGSKSEKIFAEIIKNAGTIFWNGPVGVFEWENFRHGTLTIAKAISDSEALSVVGGGDSVSAVELLGFAEKITHISTGGGASLEFMGGKDLPGIVALNENL